jgi:signal transduction histidine kinase
LFLASVTRVSELRRLIIKDQKQYAYSGIGLGLFIAQDTIKFIGGRMWLESEEGKGSTFYFSVPAAMDQAGNRP